MEHIICSKCYDDYTTSGEVPERHGMCYLAIMEAENIRKYVPTQDDSAKEEETK